MPPKKKKHNNTRTKINKNVEIIYADKSIRQEYGTIEKTFGNCHFKVINIEGEERIASLCGTIKKKCRVCVDDLVLLEPMSDSEDGKYQIIFRYTRDQRKILEKEGRLKKVEIEDSDSEDDVFVNDTEKKDVSLDVNESFIDLI